MTETPTQLPQQSPAPAARQTWLHPASAVVILGVDWLAFGAEVFTLEAAVVVASIAAFVVTAAGVFWIQRTKRHDSTAAAAIKALFAGIVAGVPTSIGGTIVGTFVLALAGLSRFRSRR